MEKKKATKKVRFFDLLDLMEEETTSINLPVPNSLRIAMDDFKNAYSERYGHLIGGGVKSIAILMMAHGSAGLKAEAEKLREEAKIPI